MESDETKSAVAFESSYGRFRDAGLSRDPEWKVRGILTDSFESKAGTMKKLFPGAGIGNCLLHEAKAVRRKLKNVSAPVCDKLSRQFYRKFHELKVKVL